MFQAQQYPTVMYLPDQDVVTVQAQQRLSRVIVAGTRNANDSVFHFRVSLVFPNDRCIRLDMSPSAVGSNIWDGLLEIQYKPYPRSETNTVAFGVAAAPGDKTVSEALAHILGNRRDRYTFHDQGYGCRYWSNVILHDLVDGHFIPGDALELFNAWEVEQHAIYGNTAFPMPQFQGRFY